MLAIFEIMFGGRMGGGASGRGSQTSQTKYIIYYILHVLYIIYYTYCLMNILYILFVISMVLAWFCVSLLKQLLIGFVYFYCFSMVVRGFSEATTDRVCNFYCCSKIRNV